MERPSLYVTEDLWNTRAASPPDAKETSGRLGELLPFAVLLLAGGTMRALVVPDARFAADEASFYEMSQSIARDGARPVLGPPVSGSGA
ncbi:MAG: hypothetical protein HYV07_27635, partial [Deltaproteobacteria bacterium]|nr:hypothetical protein [Deltaproteobacteria bacterium]